jgi:TfoX/Sxy family transcriptional regulator of competence genes
VSKPSQTPEEQFERIVAALRGEPGVAAPSEEPVARRGFGSDGLKVHGKIFAMLSGGRLVVKVPKARVDALVAAGAGERFDPRRDGRLMKEWLVVAPAATERWLPLAREALAYVGAHG